MRAKQIAFVAFLVVLLLLLGSLIFTIDWGGSNPEEIQVEKQLVLQDLSTSAAQVSYRSSGPIVADEDHRELVITVSRSEVVARLYKGYEGTVLKTQRIANNDEAFLSFLAGLQDINFGEKRVYTGVRTPEGACPTGKRFTYTLKNAGDFDFETWGTNCNKDTGTFAGSNQQVEQLFKAQVPDINDLTKAQKL